MKNQELSRLSMWWAVRRHLNAYSSIWNGNEPFSEASAMLTQAIEQARAALDVQAVTSKGVATDRILLKSEAINRTLAISQSTKAYAKVAGNSELLSAVNYGTSALTKMSHHELAAQLRTIIAAAREAGEALRKFGVTPETCDAALEAVVSMEQAQSHVRTMITGRKAVTMNIPEIMATGRKALGTMDNLIYLFAVANPEFVAGYKTARVIVHAGTRSKDGPPAAAA